MGPKINAPVTSVRAETQMGLALLPSSLCPVRGFPNLPSLKPVLVSGSGRLCCSQCLSTGSQQRDRQESQGADAVGPLPFPLPPCPFSLRHCCPHPGMWPWTSCGLALALTGSHFHPVFHVCTLKALDTRVPLPASNLGPETGRPRFSINSQL